VFLSWPSDNDVDIALRQDAKNRVDVPAMEATRALARSRM
jgi:hypothetical protein